VSDEDGQRTALHTLRRYLRRASRPEARVENRRHHSGCPQWTSGWSDTGPPGWP